MIASLRSTQEIIHAVDLTNATKADRYPGSIAASELNVEDADIVLHVNPPDFLDALSAFKADVLARNRIVAMWAWELEQVPW